MYSQACYNYKPDFDPIDPNVEYDVETNYRLTCPNCGAGWPPCSPVEQQLGFCLQEVNDYKNIKTYV